MLRAMFGTKHVSLFSALRKSLLSLQVEISCRSDLSRPSGTVISVHSVINALCRNFPAPTNEDRGDGRGRCLSEYGVSNNDTILTGATVIISGQTG